MLKKFGWYLVGAVIGIVVLAFWWERAAEPTIATDLVQELPNATQRRPTPETFQTLDISLGGESKRAIYAAEPSRIIWERVIPDRAWLSVSLGVREEAWMREGSGVLFLVGVSSGSRYSELLSLVVNPYANPADRQWLPVLLDLAPWAGQRVEIILNTRVAQAQATADNHLALWGAPAIVTR